MPTVIVELIAAVPRASAIRRGLLPLALAASAFLTACDGAPPESELPPLPEIDTRLFLPIIEEHLEDALAAAEKRPRDDATVGRLGMLLQAHDQWLGAEQAYRRARMLAPREPRWLYYHALTLEALGRNADATAVLEFAADEGLADTSMRIALATQLFEAGELQAARVRLESTLADDPDSARAHFMLGRVLVQSGEWEAAGEQLERTIELAGHFSPAYYLLAQVYRQAGDEGRAERMLELSEQYQGVQGRDADPMLAEVTRLNLSDTPLIARAQVVAGQGDLDTAIGMLNEAIRRNPESLAAHVTLVGLYGVRKEFDKADEHYEAALAIDPRSAKLYYNRGLARLSEGDLGAAQLAFKQSIELDPRDANPYVQVGLIAQRSGRPDEARERYEAALALQPQHRQANWLLGRLLVELGEFDAASEHLNAARGGADPVTPLVLESLAQAYQGLGEPDQARATLVEAQSVARSINDQTTLRRLNAALAELDRSSTAGASTP